MAVCTIKGILQRRHTEQGEPNHSLSGEGPRKRERIWNAPSKNSTAYGERNVIKVDAENKRDLRRAIAHTYRKVCYKPQGEVQTDTDGEVGGGHTSAEGWDNTTQPEERTSAFIVPSGEVSDDAGRKRPTPSE
jgi:hypothetical protein